MNIYKPYNAQRKDRFSHKYYTLETTYFLYKIVAM